MSNCCCWLLVSYTEESVPRHFFGTFRYRRVCYGMVVHTFFVRNGRGFTTRRSSHLLSRPFHPIQSGHVPECPIPPSSDTTGKVLVAPPFVGRLYFPFHTISSCPKTSLMKYVQEINHSPNYHISAGDELGTVTD